MCVCVCVWPLQGPDQSAEVVRGPHCGCRASGSHTAGAQGEGPCSNAHTQTHIINADTSRDASKQICFLWLPPLLIHPPPPQPCTRPTSIHYSPPQSIMPHAILISRNAPPLVFGNPQHIILMTRAKICGQSETLLGSGRPFRVSSRNKMFLCQAVKNKQVETLQMCAVIRKQTGVLLTRALRSAAETRTVLNRDAG